MEPGDPAAVEQLFDSVAPSYDRLNDLLSLGLHRHWKRRLVSMLKPAPGEHWLDLCCGTGDLAFLLARAVRPGGTVVGLDSAASPLQRAEQRHRQEPWLPLSFRQADALRTGLSPASMDGVVMAYGLRNLEDPALGLREVRRLLKPGGRAGILDFNRLEPQAIAARFQTLYLRRIVVPVASASGLREQYAYLEKSLQRFPTGREQERLALAAGFQQASHHTLSGNQMGILALRA
ncbi:MAG: bifunctional demethylmenaquinone methyltransferase/2-methoxy-6-polyprenyl-1,4-benzoquinol methylase UbiE [Synechococcus sp. ARS1019]|nr:bifunctional demethylmenaquinone methyltransferase/2-methoxy-6-polyprenyl-1,4-benzoquinol methylase UbiE [Synechococcus sp. ARS1019]